MIPSGSATVSRAVQYRKSFSLSSAPLSGRVTFFRFGQSLKASLPMVFTPCSTVRVSREKIPAKAASPIFPMVPGTVTSLSPVEPAKAMSEMALTCFPPICRGWSPCPPYG